MINAYSNKDFDIVNQYSGHVYFKPLGGEYIPIPTIKNDFLAMMTDPYDSIVRNIRSIVPEKKRGDNAGVCTNFDETTYGKDGTNKSNTIDRMGWRW